MTTTSPDDLAEVFIKDRKGNVADKTLYNNRGHLREFCKWCSENSVHSLRNLDGMDLLEYKFNLEDGGKAGSTIKNHFSTLRVFFQFTQRVGATTKEQDLHNKLQAPDFAKGDLSRDIMVDYDRVKRILDYLDRFEYATEKHVMFAVFWHAGCRLGALRGLDLEDYTRAGENQKGDYGIIEFQHRPETGTPLKNGEDGQRMVAVFPPYCDVIEDYIDTRRRQREDEHGRKPLLTSPSGRYHESNIQATIYALTRPCYYSNTCPHNRDTAECEAVYWEHASKCPSSVSPHPMRRTAITYHLETGMLKEDASGRFNVSVPVLDEHYDESREHRRMENRVERYFQSRR